MPTEKNIQSRKPLLLSTVVTLALLSLITLNERSSVPVNAQTLQAAGPLKWYRGNLHTHSLWSDGDDYLESIAMWYRDHTYNFLAFTDHNVLADKALDRRREIEG